ncbi:hypothetical protein BOX15_Mlig013570g2 [Macrostomum lignano]|uniref:WD_REPEATS_REGION domain-containing protein n=2 Tax=Macrostomum lignano TaxID=282301 RepID=A0A1I8JAM9_9PLAT|nr:hypothetical protein BOX15_Mlig013570g2 [Macrostomum lignano]
METLPENDTFSALLIGFMGVVIFMLLYFFQSSRKKDSTSVSSIDEKSNWNAEKNGKQSSKSASQPSAKQPKPTTKKDAKSPQFTHEWLACTLKGHTGNVLDIDFSPNGKYLISCDDDRSCFLWFTKDWSVRKAVSSVKVPLQLDHGSRVAFSPDSKAFIVNLYNSRSLAVYKLARSTDDPARKTPLTVSHLSEFQHQDPGDPAELLSLGVASTGGFVMTCYSDTRIKLWSRRGDHLATIDTCHMTNCMAAVSPCGRFVASCGFTPDVKVWEVSLDKSGSGLSGPPARAFELKGHNAQVDGLAFSADSTRMATASKDTTWKLWNIDVRYKLGEDPKLLVTGRFRRDGLCRIALSPDARCVAIATGVSVTVYSCLDASQLAQFSGLHQGAGVSRALFHPRAQFLVTCGSDRHMPVLLNVPGARAAIADCAAKAKSTQSRAQREMFEQELAETRAFLAGHGVATGEAAG